MIEQPEKIVRYIVFYNHGDPCMQATRICASHDIIHEEANKLRLRYEIVKILRE